MLLDRLNQDLKVAMLAGDKLRVEAIKNIKTALQYAAVGAKAAGKELDEAQENSILQRESKKRAESAELYDQGNAPERAQKERDEKVLIDAYLPAQLGEAELAKLIDEAISETGGLEVQTMGKVIGLVKSKAGASADGGTIAKMVKDRL